MRRASWESSNSNPGSPFGLSSGKEEMILFVALHILVCCFLILVVLLQSGKAGDLASTFGGGGSQTAFGTRSATSFADQVHGCECCPVHGDLPDPGGLGEEG